uniref:Glutaredoxin domain-containing protein n=1 Tax=Araucaria cunninghamii TaxID=56994 RepID=A0A0D6QS19_ARACU
MGCANSKDHYHSEGNLNRPIPRSYSMPVHHPAEKKGDSYHVVALTSSTYGILKMDRVGENAEMEGESRRRKAADRDQHPHGLYNLRRSLDISSEMAARTWSEVNTLLQNYTPFRSHSKSSSQAEEPETINTWELMEGLEDNAGSPLPLTNGHHHHVPLHNTKSTLRKSFDRSFSCHTVRDVEQLSRDEPKLSVWHRVTPGVRIADENMKPSPKNPKKEETAFGVLASQVQSEVLGDPLATPGDSIARPLWMQQATDETVRTLFDPDLISTFRKALDEISPMDADYETSPAPTQGSEDEKVNSGRLSRQRSNSFQARLNIFQQRIDESVAKASRVLTTPQKFSSPVKTTKQQRTPAPPGGEDKVVLYSTSLRGIRKTFEDCCAVKMILQGFRVRVDERDISMHALFRQELQDLLGKPVTVPRLFIGGKYIGGVEEIQQLHEVGELAKYLEGCPLHSCFEPCEGCGDVCFVLCHNCNGSRKIFRDDGAILRCWQCNENGLIRCPLCCC